jgi:DNA-binding response OmpR family regulator
VYEELSQKRLERKQRSVLIVEDDPDVAALLKFMLVEEGFNGDVANDADEARKLLQLNPNHYKAITVDLLLPGQDGVSFIDELRKDKATRDLPVVVVSAVADEAKRNLSGGAIGVADWLQKPIDQPRLLDAIKHATTSGRMPRVLHVEDEVDVHRVVSVMLQDICELTWTTTLAASREALAEDVFDLVLLDIGLPDGSGLDLLDTLEQYAKPPRVVIFSAQDVSQEYADRVSAVLGKSRTDNLALAKMITQAIEW